MSLAAASTCEPPTNPVCPAASSSTSSSPAPSRVLCTSFTRPGSRRSSRVPSAPPRPPGRPRRPMSLTSLNPSPPLRLSPPALARATTRAGFPTTTSTAPSPSASSPALARSRRLASRCPRPRLHGSCPPLSGYLAAIRVTDWGDDCLGAAGWIGEDHGHCALAEHSTWRAGVLDYVGSVVSWHLDKMY